MGWWKMMGQLQLQFLLWRTGSVLSHLRIKDHWFIFGGWFCSCNVCGCWWWYALFALCYQNIVCLYIYRGKCGGFSLAFSTRTFLHLWMLKPGRLHLVDLWAGRRCKWIQSNHLVRSLRKALMWQHWKWMRMSWSTSQGTRMCTRSLGMWISYTLAWQHWTAIGMILGKFSKFCGEAGAAIALRSSLWKQNISQDQHLWKQTFTIFCIYKVFFWIVIPAEIAVYGTHMYTYMLIYLCIYILLDLWSFSLWSYLRATCPTIAFAGMRMLSKLCWSILEETRLKICGPKHASVEGKMCVVALSSKSFYTGQKPWNKEKKVYTKKMQFPIGECKKTVWVSTQTIFLYSIFSISEYMKTVRAEA